MKETRNHGAGQEANTLQIGRLVGNRCCGRRYALSDAGNLTLIQVNPPACTKNGFLGKHRDGIDERLSSPPSVMQFKAWRWRLAQPPSAAPFRGLAVSVPALASVQAARRAGSPRHAGRARRQ